MNDREGGFLRPPTYLIRSGDSELTPQDWHINDLTLITFWAEAKVTARPELLCHFQPLPGVDSLWGLTTESEYTRVLSLALQPTIIWSLLPFQPLSPHDPHVAYVLVKLYTLSWTFSPSSHFCALTEGIPFAGMPFPHLYLLKSWGTSASSLISLLWFLELEVVLDFIRAVWTFTSLSISDHD